MFQCAQERCSILHLQEFYCEFVRSTNPCNEHTGMVIPSRYSVMRIVVVIFISQQIHSQCSNRIQSISSCRPIKNIEKPSFNLGQFNTISIWYSWSSDAINAQTLLNTRPISPFTFRRMQPIHYPEQMTKSNLNSIIGTVYLCVEWRNIPELECWPVRPVR